MLSFHEPHSLMAEAALAAVALLVVLYRVCGGSNEWLRTHGVILVTYSSFGGLAYDELEGWPLGLFVGGFICGRECTCVKLRVNK